MLHPSVEQHLMELEDYRMAGKDLPLRGPGLVHAEVVPNANSWTGEKFDVAESW